MNIKSLHGWNRLFILVTLLWVSFGIYTKTITVKPPFPVDDISKYLPDDGKDKEVSIEDFMLTFKEFKLPNDETYPSSSRYSQKEIDLSYEKVKSDIDKQNLVDDLKLFVLPPLVLYFIGWLIGWVIRGFKKKD